MSYRWRNGLVWGGFAFVMFFVFTLAIGTVMRVPRAEALVKVTDTQNTVQNTKTAISTATTAVNTATQIANDIKNLASMSPEGILAHYLGISEELGDVIDVWKAYNGLMSATKTMDQAWNSAFKQVDSFFDGETSTAKHFSDSQSTLKALETTYKDSMNTAKQVSDLQSSKDELQKAINRSSNAIGSKEVNQAGNQLLGLGVKEDMKTNLLYATDISITSGMYQYEIMKEAESLSERKTATENFSTAVTTIKSAVSNKDGSSIVLSEGGSEDEVTALKKIGAIK